MLATLRYIGKYINNSVPWRWGWVCFACYNPIWCMKGISIPLVINRHKIHNQIIIFHLIHTVYSDLKSRKHSSASLSDNQGNLSRGVDNITVSRLGISICSLFSNTQFIRKQNIPKFWNCSPGPSNRIVPQIKEVLVQLTPVFAIEEGQIEHLLQFCCKQIVD